MSCMHCDDPACMKVCPMKAIHKGPHGEVLVDQQKCIGCKMCANACPYDVPVFNTEGRTSYFGDKQPLVVRPAKPHTERTPGKAEHCTLCVHRTERGLLPACVEACGIHAMTLVDYDSKDPEVQALIKRSICLSEEAGTQPKVRYICSNMDFKSVKLK
ncbi:MAG: 4Fe-4S dicluster domain-containing protein [Sutterella wadsworthensis]